MPQVILVPISQIFGDVLPGEWLVPQGEVLNQIAVDSSLSETVWDDTQFTTRHRIVILIEVEFDVPIIPGMSVRIGRPGAFPDFILEISSTPELHFSLKDIEITLHFPPNILQAYTPNDSRSEWTKASRDDGSEIEGYNVVITDLGIEGTVNVGFSFLSPSLEVPRAAMISDSGFILDFGGGTVEHLPRPIFGDIPEDLRENPALELEFFEGLYLPRLSIVYYKADSGTRLPEITLTEAFIGTGGFTGNVILGNVDPEPNVSAEQLAEVSFDRAQFYEGGVGFEIAGMEVILWHMALSFSQSVPDAFLLTGLAFIPFADKWIKFKMNVGGPDADFMLEIGGAADESLISLEHELFEIKADSIAYKLKDEVHYAIIKGSLRPKLEGFDWPEMKVDGLSISSEGDVDIPGGWLKAPNEVTLDFHAFKIGISEIGFGNEGEEPNKRQWLGFSGSISLVEGLPITASVEGLKFSWLKEPADGDRDLKVSLEGIAVSLEIPNTLKFEGSVRYKEYTVEEPAPNGLVGHLFSGNIHINIMALRTEVAGELIIGKLKTPEGHEFTCFYIVLAVELPSAIPLAATGTGIYGLKGLVGLHVGPTKAEESWYEWYKADPARNVTSVRKWQPIYDNYAFGAGLTLGTMYDDGFTINLKVLLVVLIPGPVIMLEGKANLLKQRGGDTEQEGAFYTLVVIDGREGTFQMNIDIRYTLEDIITVGAGMEAFFDFNDSSNWFVHIGKKTPESKRIRADILSLFKATAYFMIDSKSLMIGASAGFDFKESYGPVSISFIAKVSFDAAIFWKPLQLEGSIEMLIELALKIFGIGLELFIQLLLEGKAADPYWLHGVARIGLKLPWPLPKLEVEAEFTWEGGQRTEPVKPLLKSAAFIHHKNKGLSWDLTAYASGEEPPETEYTLIPVDATPVLSLARLVHNLKKVDSDEPLLPFVKDEVGGEEFSYQLEDLILREKGPDDTSWSVVKNNVNTDENSFILTTESFQNDPEANEPILSLWQYHNLQGSTLYEREDYTERRPACSRRVRHRYHFVHWLDVGEDRNMSANFTHMDLRFMADVYASEGPFVSNGWLYAPRLTIRWSEAVSLVVLMPSGQSAGISARGFYRGSFVGNFVVGTAGRLGYSNDNAPIDSVRVEILPGHSELFILEGIVYKTTRERYEEEASDRDDHPLAEEAAHNGRLHLKPNRYYQLEVHTGVAGTNGAYSETNFFYFRTDDGPGIHHIIPLANPEVPEDSYLTYFEKPVNQLDTYIHRILPRDGAPYFYYSYDIGIHFNEAYTEDLFWEDLELKLFDRNGREETAGPPLPGLPYLPLPHPGLITWLRDREANACGSAVEHQAPHWRFTTPERLRPNRQYQAKLVTIGRTGDEHKLAGWQFTTSRFRSFTEHFESALREGEVLLHSLRLGEPIRVNTDAGLSDLATERDHIANRSRDFLGESNFLEQVDKLELLNGALDEFRKNNFTKFKTLDTLFEPHFAAVNLDKRPLPEKLEFIQILLFRENNAVLLIESPEPVAWERLSARIEAEDGTVHNLGFLANDDGTKAYVFRENTFKFPHGTFTWTVNFDGSINPEAGILFDNGIVVEEEVRTVIRVGD